MVRLTDKLENRLIGATSSALEALQNVNHRRYLSSFLEVDKIMNMKSRRDLASILSKTRFSLGGELNQSLPRKGPGSSTTGRNLELKIFSKAELTN
jgi:hypothetical protein